MSQANVATSPKSAPQQSAPQQPEAAQQSRGYEDITLMPPVDVVEDATGITLYADLPGVSREQLELSVEGDALTIEGNVTFEMPQGLQASYAEVGSSRYRRVFTLSKELDPGKISAELKHGVLKLRIPKAEHAQPRRIEVQSH